MAAQVTRAQAEAMDETMAFDAGHHAQAYAKANLHHLADECGVVVDQSEAQLIRRIGVRQGLLATAPLTPKQRRALEEANDLDEQQIALMHAAKADAEGGRLARGAYWLAIAILAIVGALHLAAKNWGG